MNARVGDFLLLNPDGTVTQLFCDLRKDGWLPPNSEEWRRLLAELAAAEARVVGLEEQREGFTQECHDLMARVRTRRDERDALKAELERVYAHNHDLEAAIAMGEQTVETLTAQLATARGLLEAARAFTGASYRETSDYGGCYLDHHDLEELITAAERYRDAARAALANGTEPPDCARCRRDDCWPDCARFYDKPELPQ